MKHFMMSLIITILLASSCGNNKNNKSEKVYFGPGSNYNFSISGNSFKLTETISDLEISGSIETTTDSFEKLTVTNSSNQSLIEVGQTTFGLTVANKIFVLRPFTNNKQPILLISNDGCPEVSIAHNWVGSNIGTDISSNILSGTISLDISTEELKLGTAYNISGINQGYQSIGTSKCSSGLIENGDDSLTYINDNLSISHLGKSTINSSDDLFLFGLKQKKISSVSDLDGNYIGFQYGQTLSPIKATLSSGSGTVTQYDPETKSTSTIYTTSINSINNPSIGLINASIESGLLKCAADTNLNDSNNKVIICIGQSPVDSNDLQGFILITK